MTLLTTNYFEPLLSAYTYAPKRVQSTVGSYELDLLSDNLSLLYEAGAQFAIGIIHKSITRTIKHNAYDFPVHRSGALFLSRPLIHSGNMWHGEETRGHP